MTRDVFSMYDMKMETTGKTRREYRYKNKEKSFKYWFNNTLNCHVVLIDGISREAVIQDHNQSNNKELSDDKYIITKNDSNMNVGSIVKWSDKIWLVSSEEAKTIKTHKQAKMKECNTSIKWIIDKDKKNVCNNGLGHPAYVQNQTLYTLGVSTSSEFVWIQNSKMMIYISNNKETSKIHIGQRFFINNEVYKVMFVDSISRRGVIHCLMEVDPYNPEVDNMERGIANYYNGDSTDVEKESDNSPILTEFFISGEEKVKRGSNPIFTIKDVNDNSITGQAEEWTVVPMYDAELVVNDSNENSVGLHITDTFKNVGQMFMIYVKLKNGETLSKNIKIIKK